MDLNTLIPVALEPRPARPAGQVTSNVWRERLVLELMRFLALFTVMLAGNAAGYIPPKIQNFRKVGHFAVWTELEPQIVIIGKRRAIDEVVVAEDLTTHHD